LRSGPQNSRPNAAPSVGSTMEPRCGCGWVAAPSPGPWLYVTCVPPCATVPMVGRGQPAASVPPLPQTRDSDRPARRFRSDAAGHRRSVRVGCYASVS
jgi:hypothetical protein